LHLCDILCKYCLYQDIVSQVLLPAFLSNFVTIRNKNMSFEFSAKFHRYFQHFNLNAWFI
jgi:hypothetical protein